MAHDGAGDADGGVDVNSMTVIAAIDDSAAAGPVLATTAALGDMLQARVRALHVLEGGGRAARAAAKAAPIELQVVHGSTLSVLLEAAEAPATAMLVLGARGTPAGRVPLGRTAMELARAVRKPIVVVPPQCRCPALIRRVLVPLDGTNEAAAAVRETIDLAGSRQLDVIVLHVYDERSTPMFSDQPHHEIEAWSREFLRRCCSGVDEVDLITRVGPPGEHVLSVRSEVRADLIALGWSQDWTAGRALTVQSVLSGSHVPVTLVPIPKPGGSTARQAESEP